MYRSFSQEDIKLIEDCYILGYLATDERNFPIIGEEQQPVTHLKKNSEYILFYVKPISTLPDKLNELPGPWENNLFIGFEKGLESIQMPPDYWYLNDIEEKKNCILGKLKNKLILFKPYIKREECIGKNEIFYRNLVIKDIEDAVIEHGKRYIPIPSPNVSSKDFERAIIQQAPVSFPIYNREMQDPELILCEDYIYSNLKWQKNRNGKRIIQSAGDVRRISIPDDFYDNIIYKVEDGLIFIDCDYYDKIKINIVKKEGMNIFQNKSDEDFKGNTKSEWDFLMNLRNYIINDGLCYNDEDVYNFHISIKTNPLTIISGMAGIGKTRLAVSYAKSLGLDEEHYLIVPISPAYTEPADVIGYLNTSKGEYVSSETGLVDILKKSQDNPDEIFMVIFDEMNLSQVEYWFSPFISLLEMENSDRKLILYNSHSNCINSEYYPSSITIGNNIIFVGTVNIDETTKDFSDRLLDRANVITPKKVSFIEMRDILKNKRGNLESYNDFKSSSFMNSWRRRVDIPTDVFKEIELKFLDRLHSCINTVDKQKGVSHRTLQHIADYILNIPENSDGCMVIDRGTAFDLQVKQRILTKVKGHQEQYGKLIGIIDKGEIRDSQLYNLLVDNEFKDVSSFKFSIEELKRKAGEMYYNGYSY